MESLIGFVFSTVGLVIGLIFSIVLYVFSAIGFYTLAKNAGIKHAWFAWIPILQFYLLGELDGDNVLGIPYAKWILLLGPIAVNIISNFVTNSMVIIILSALVYCYEASAYYKLFNTYAPNRAFIYTLTGVLIPPLMGIWAFMIRNKSRNTMY